MTSKNSWSGWGPKWFYLRWMALAELQFKGRRSEVLDCWMLAPSLSPGDQEVVRDIGALAARGFTSWDVPFNYLKRWISPLGAHRNPSGTLHLADLVQVPLVLGTVLMLKHGLATSSNLISQRGLPFPCCWTRVRSRSRPLNR